MCMNLKSLFQLGSCDRLWLNGALLKLLAPVSGKKFMYMPRQRRSLLCPSLTILLNLVQAYAGKLAQG